MVSALFLFSPFLIGFSLLYLLPHSEIASAKTPTEEVDLGALNLTLRFEAETNVFTVKLVQAQALVPRDFSGKFRGGTSQWY